MGIQGLYNADTSRASNQITNFFETAKALLGRISAGFTTAAGSIWDGGFAGVSNFEGLKEAIDNYQKNLVSILNEQKGNSHEIVEQGLKGKAGYMTGVFLTETMNLLKAYVNVVLKWKEELDQAYEKYNAGDDSLAINQVEKDVAEVRDAARNIDIG